MADDSNWFQAAESGDIAALRLMIVEGADLDARDEQERTAFQIASMHKYTDLMTTILAARRMRYMQSIGIDLTDEMARNTQPSSRASRISRI